MFSDNEKISLRQLQILLIIDMFGTIAVVLPRKVVEYANQDGWVIVIGIVILSVLYAFILSTLADMFRGETIVDFGRKLLPKIIYYIVILGLIIKILVLTAMQLRIFSEIMTEMLLYNTPVEVVIVTMLLATSHIARKGFEARARLGELLIGLMFIPLGFILFAILFKPTFENLLPILKTPKKEIFNGIKGLSFSFHGLEFILLVYPFLANAKKARKAIIEAVLLLGTAMFIITIITISHFGALEVNRQIWPVMQLMQAVDLPGSFMERQDAFIISFWILSAFMSISAGLHFTSLIFSRLTKATEAYHFVLPLIPILYILALLPPNIVATYDLIGWFEKYFGMAYLLVIPVILLIIAKIKGSKMKNEK